MIFVDESDTCRGVPLYQVLVETLVLLVDVELVDVPVPRS